MYNIPVGDGTGYGVSCGVRALISLDISGDIRAYIGPDAPCKPTTLQGTNVSILKGYTYIFSDAVSFGNGAHIAKHIKDYGLGDIIEHGPVRNPNSGNMIKTWIWTYNGNTGYEHEQKKIA